MTALGPGDGALARSLPPLVAARRGTVRRTETLHCGAVCAVDGDGREIYAAGDTSIPFPLRSTSKPFQLLPFLLDGLDAELEPGSAGGDIAVMMASHSGEPMHVARVAALLARFDLRPEDLRCGVHPPYSEAARDALVREGAAPTQLHSNCSGKHAAMLAVCRSRGWPLADYDDPDHPLQDRVRSIVAAMCDVPEPIEHSIDGCSLPTWSVPTAGLARAFARLARPDAAPALEGRDVAVLLARLFEAGTEHPGLIAGTGRFDALLMQAMPGAIFVKGGAAGLVAAAVAPTPRHPTGLGVAVKILDGDSGGRVRAVTLLATLRALDVGDGTIDGIEDGVVRNVAGLEVGHLEPLLPDPG